MMILRGDLLSLCGFVLATAILQGAAGSMNIRSCWFLSWVCARTSERHRAQHDQLASRLPSNLSRAT
eukprot:8120455-Pyramimonas_sp.AAC.1